VLPAFAGVVPVEAELGKLAADLLGRGLGEGDPDPLANYFGQVVLSRQEFTNEVEDLVGGESAILVALGEVDERQDPVGLWRSVLVLRCSSDRFRSPFF
jgi:hypothetical protein